MTVSSASQPSALSNSGTATLILVRHGRTALNAAGCFQGHTDTPLDDIGRQQAEAAAQALAQAGYQADVIYSSDLPRALQTAQAVQAALGGQLESTPALREIHFGEWDKRPVQEMAQRFPTQTEQFRSGDPTFTFPNGESGQQVADRIEAFVRAHLPAAGKTGVVVAHQLTLFALLTRLLKQDYQKVWPTRRFYHDNAAYTVLTLGTDGKIEAADIGRADHLAGLV